jgi:pyrroline-5-carboxylate reductase
MPCIPDGNLIKEMKVRMNNQKRFVIIGPGVMGEAITMGLINKQVVQASQIILTGPRIERLQELEAKYGVQISLDNAAAINNADVIILCVKPQKLPAVMSELHGKIPNEALVISIVAGTTIQSLALGLDHSNILRAMPNTPAQVGEGMTVWSHKLEIKVDQHTLAQQILAALGEEIFVEEEAYIDMATAVSGTGPAYVFLFVEALIDAGVHLGLPRRIAEEMVLQTIKGSVSFYVQNQSHPARLRNQVTSPGGTSATALYYLEKMGFRTAISRAIWAAFTRSQELGKGQNHQDPEKI